MGLIIKDKLQAMKKGYPTVSDKYDVVGGLLEGQTAVEFGDLVCYGSTTGYYTAPEAGETAPNIAGFVVATNVQLSTTWPATTVKVEPNTSFGLLLHGFIAAELAPTAKIDDVKPNAKVYVTADGKVTTENDETETVTELANAVFTGFYENQGDTTTPVYICEVYVK